MQGCQMVYFQTENSNLDIFWKALESKFLIYFMALGIFMVIWYKLWLFWYILWYLIHFPRFGMLYQKKSGNPVVIATLIRRDVRERQLADYRAVGYVDICTVSLSTSKFPIFKMSTKKTKCT
jgi:hypothetical protein